MITSKDVTVTGISDDGSKIYYRLNGHQGGFVAYYQGDWWRAADVVAAAARQKYGYQAEPVS